MVAHFSGKVLASIRKWIWRGCGLVAIGASSRLLVVLRLDGRL